MAAGDPVVPFGLTGTFVPVTVDHPDATDNTLPRDLAPKTLTLDNGNEDPSQRIYACVTIYQPPTSHDLKEFDRIMHDHVPPLERHMIVIGNHYEVAYITRDEWNTYQEAYTQLQAEMRGRSVGLQQDLTAVPASVPLFRSTPVFNSVMFVKDLDVPAAARGHLKRTNERIVGTDGIAFDCRGFVATNAEAERFLEGRGYVRVGFQEENGRLNALFLSPFDAQLYHGLPQS